MSIFLWTLLFFLSILGYFFISPTLSLATFAVGAFLLSGFRFFQNIRQVTKGSFTVLSPENFPFLTRFAEDVTAKNVFPLEEKKRVGRAEEYEVAEILLSRSKPESLAIVGPPGCGKSFFLFSLFQALREKGFLFPSQPALFRLDLREVMAQAVGTHSEKEHFVGALLEEAVSFGKAFIILEGVTEFWGRGDVDLSRILEEYAQRPELSLLLEIRDKDHRFLKKKKQLSAFTPLFLRSPNQREAREIVEERLAPLVRRCRIFTPEGEEHLFRSLESLTDGGVSIAGLLHHTDSLIDFWKEKGKPYIDKSLVELFFGEEAPEVFRKEASPYLLWRKKEMR